MVGLVVVLLVLVPVVELYVLVQVAQAIGILPALLLLALVSVAGASLVRRQGIGMWRRAQASVQAGRAPTDEVVGGAVLLGAGTLLVIPGFVASAVGLLLLLPPIRRLVGRRLAHRWRTRPARFGGGMRVVDVEHIGDVTARPPSTGDRGELGGPR